MALKSSKVVSNTRGKSLRHLHSSPPLRCGLVVVLSQSPKSKKVDHAAFRKSVESLRHRGPDNINSWFSADATVALGHARLSIVDLSPNGNQPLTDSTGTIHFVVNGEIYDYKQHVRDLKDYPFKTGSDSEVFIALYRKYGLRGALERIRGEYAIVGWNENTGELFAAKDRFGIKPLYYAVHDGKLHLASEIKALLELGVPPIWDLETCRGAFQLKDDRTYFKGIHQLPPGHFLTASIHSTEVKIERYWDLTYPHEYEPSTKSFTYKTDRTEEQIVNELREILLNSIQTRLVADVPVGVYLSGGLDSTSLLGMARHLMGPSTPIKTFTVSFEESADHDEAAIATRMAQHANAEMHVMKWNSGLLADHFPGAIYHLEQPVFNMSSIAKYQLSKLVRDIGYKVVLTGEGSDEIFGGYGPFVIENYLRGGLTEQQKEEIREYLKLGSTARSAVPPETSLQTHFTSQLGHTPFVAEFLSRTFFNVMNDVMRDESQVHDSVVEMNRLAYLINPAMRNWHPVNTGLYVWIKTGLAHMLLTQYADRMEMAHSVEGRVPFLDHKVVEFVNQIPTNIKIQPRFDKWILRQAVKPFVTNEVIERKKQPFLGPTPFKKGTKFYDYVNQTLRSSVPPFLDHAKVVQKLDALDRIEADQVAEDIPLFVMTSLAEMEKQFKMRLE